MKCKVSVWFTIDESCWHPNHPQTDAYVFRDETFIRGAKERDTLLKNDATRLLVVCKIEHQIQLI